MAENVPVNGNTAPSRSKFRWIQPVILGAVCAAVIATLAFVANTVGSPVEWNTDPANANYNLMVRGFRAGQLNLDKEVPPGLKALADPYDPQANLAYRKPPYKLHDMSYYKGKLYLYFGAVPAVVLFWPWVALTGHYLFHWQATFIFCAAGFVASAWILVMLWRRYFSEVGVGVVAACMLALGLATGTPVLLQRPSFYEVAIICAYPLVMLAFGAILRALHDRKHRGRWLAVASLLYGLAVGSRPSLLFGAIILLVPVAQVWLASSGNRSRWLIPGLLGAAIGPITLIGAGLMTYNFLRFDNPMEFGWHYEMAGARQDFTSPFFMPRYFWFHVRVYFMEPARLSSHFPFVRDIAAPTPAGHSYVENTYGVSTNIPVLWLALAAPLMCRNRGPEFRSVMRWFLTAVVLFFGISALTVCLFAGACFRYELDFLPALVLLAVLGILGLDRALAARPAWRNTARLGWGILLAVSVAFNLLAPFKFYAEERCGVAMMLTQSGRYPEAISNYEKALRINPDLAEAHMGLAETLLRTNRASEAIPHFEQVLRLIPDNSDVENDLGAALAQAGHHQDATLRFARALRLNPDHVRAHMNLARELESAGMTREALAHYGQAMRLQPDSAEARANFYRLMAQTMGNPGH